MAQNDVKYEIYLLNVPFNKDYKHIVHFTNKTTQANTFIDRAINNDDFKYGKHYTNLNIIVKNEAFILRGRWDSFNKCNYMMYRYHTTYSDGPFTSEWFYAFIDDVKYNSRIGTIITHTLDVWQTYHIDAKYRRCFVERGHVKKSDDIIGEWVAPEPIGFAADEERDLDALNEISFKAIITVETISLAAEADMKDATTQEVKTGIMVKYGGRGIGSIENGYGDLSGIYRIVPNEMTNNTNDLEKILQVYSEPEWVLAETVVTDPDTGTWIPFQILNSSTYNHISDIVGFSFIPKFVYDGALKIDFPKGNTNVGKLLNSNQIVTDTDYVKFNNNSLACGYQPHNKKMYTSLARGFKLYNKNGLCIPLKPELLDNLNDDDKKINIYLSMKPYASQMRIRIDDYKITSDRFIDVPYAFTLELGLNNNVGVSRATNVQNIQNEMNYSMAKMTAKGVDIGFDMLDSGIKTAASIGNAAAGGSISSSARLGIGALESLESAALKSITFPSEVADVKYKAQMAYDTALASISTAVGNMSDTNNINEENIKIRLADVSPIESECKLIEEFLDTYGYAINKHMDLDYFISNTNRPYWTYIKTSNAVNETDSPINDNIIFNNIFNNGTTIWRDIDEVGNYSLRNW